MLTLTIADILFIVVIRSIKFSDNYSLWLLFSVNLFASTCLFFWSNVHLLNMVFHCITSKFARLFAIFKPLALSMQIFFVEEGMSLSNRCHINHLVLRIHGFVQLLLPNQLLTTTCPTRKTICTDPR